MAIEIGEENDARLVGMRRVAEDVPRQGNGGREHGVIAWQITGVERHGRYLLMRLDGPDVLLVDLGATGALVRAKTARATVTKGTHVVITFTQGGQLRYADPKTTGEMFVTPLEGIADPTRTPNPAKAPWYFLGLQELVSHSAFIGGVLVPALVVLALVVLPYLDRRPDGVGRWFAPERRVANTIFTTIAAIAIVLTVIGTFFRGPNWAWVWPW